MSTITDKLERLNNQEPTHCFCVPGVTMIDEVNPHTGRSCVYGRTLDDVQTEYPGAELMTIADYCAKKAAAQDSPIQWDPITEDYWQEMLEVLPPAAYSDIGFLVGEPTDHHAQSGRPRFVAYIRRNGQHLESSRPLTIQEFNALNN